MGFKLVSTFGFDGQPSQGKAKLRIRLADGTKLIATDEWPHFPQMTLVLHPDHLPRRVAGARRELLQQVRGMGATGARLNDIYPKLSSKLAVGDPGVTVVVRFGIWTEPIRTITYNIKVVRLEVIA